MCLCHRLAGQLSKESLLGLQYYTFELCNGHTLALYWVQLSTSSDAADWQSHINEMFNALIHYK